MSVPSDDLPQLGSLAQSARNKNIRCARKTLIVIGILMTIGQTIMYFVERDQLKTELEKQIRRQNPGIVLTPQEVKEIEAAGQLAFR